MNRRLSDDRIEDSDVLLSQSTQKNSNGTNCNDPTDKSGCKYFVMGQGWAIQVDPWIRIQPFQVCGSVDPDPAGSSLDPWIRGSVNPGSPIPVMGCYLLVKRIKVTFRKELEIFHLVVASLFCLLQSLPLL